MHVLLLVFLLLVQCVSAFAAGNESVTPLPATQPNASSYSIQRTWDQQEIPAIFSRYFSVGWVESGGTHPTAAGMTSAAFATEAFTNSGNRVRALSDGTGGSAAINYTTAGCAVNDTAWVIISAMTANSSGNFSRVTGTNYFVNCTDTSEPSLPLDSAWLMKVTITASAITTVVFNGLNTPIPAYIQTSIYNVLEHGLVGDCSTNDAAAFQNLANKVLEGSTLFFPQTSTACYQFSTTRVNITKAITILCEGWTTSLTWDTENATDPGCPDAKTCNYGGLNIYDPDVTDGDYLSHVIVKDCHFKFGGTRGNTWFTHKRGLNVYQANNVTIANNWFENITAEVVGVGNFGSATKGERGWIVQNLFTNFAQVGINPNNFSMNVESNRFRTGAIAIEFGRSGTIVQDNEAFDLTGQLVAIQATNGSVDGNICRTCYTTNPASTDGVISVNDRGSCTGTSALTISNNIIVNTTSPANAAGIAVFNSGSACSPPERNSHINVQNNQIGTSFQTGIYIHQCDNCLITGNDVQGAITPLAITTGVGLVLRSAFSDNRLNTSAGVNFIQDASVFADGNLVGWNYVNTTTGPLSAKWGSNLVAFTDLDTTPSVRGNFFWSVNNSAATNITALDDIQPAAPPVCLRTTNGNTTFVDGAGLQMAGSVNFTATANDVICFANDGAITYEVSRSAN